jgi:hypothetical protein
VTLKYTRSVFYTGCCINLNELKEVTGTVGLMTTSSIERTSPNALCKFYSSPATCLLSIDLRCSTVGIRLCFYVFSLIPRRIGMAAWDKICSGQTNATLVRCLQSSFHKERGPESELEGQVYLFQTSFFLLDGFQPYTASFPYTLRDIDKIVELPLTKPEPQDAHPVLIYINVAHV